jgi:tetratricopeptide (TPR) repeat protein
MGKNDKASESYQQAIDSKVMQDDRTNFSHYGSLALRNKDYTIALQAFDKAIFISHEATNYYNKFLLYVLKKEWDKVVPLIKKTLSFNPGMDEARVMMQKVERWKKMAAKAEAAPAT